VPAKVELVLSLPVRFAVWVLHPLDRASHEILYVLTVEVVSEADAVGVVVAGLVVVIEIPVHGGARITLRRTHRKDEALEAHRVGVLHFDLHFLAREFADVSHRATRLLALADQTPAETIGECSRAAN